MSAAARHLEKAADALEESGKARVAGKNDLADYYMRAARIRAALATVHEQRTANLIAAFERDAIQPPHESAAANKPFWNALAVDITERLDLA